MTAQDKRREHLRKRFLATGLDTFSPLEILELLLFFAIPKRDTKSPGNAENTGDTGNAGDIGSAGDTGSAGEPSPIARALLDRYGTLSGVLAAPLEELQTIGGMGQGSALLLKLVPEFSRAIGREEAMAALTAAGQVGQYLIRRFEGLKEETVYELCMDDKGRLLTSRKIGEGGISSVSLNVRKLVENAVLSGASGVILAHNHPGSRAVPSQEDIRATNTARKALKTIGVTLLDHVIVAGEEYFSFRDSEDGFLWKNAEKP